MLINTCCGVLKQSPWPFIIADGLRWVGHWSANKWNAIEVPHPIESGPESHFLLSSHCRAPPFILWNYFLSFLSEVLLVISISQEDVSILVFSVKLKENKCAMVKQRSVFETISKYCSVMMNLKASVSDSEAHVGCFEWETIERWLTSKSVCEHTQAVARLSPWGCAVLGRKLGMEEKPFMGTGGLGDLFYFTLAL